MDRLAFHPGVLDGPRLALCLSAARARLADAHSYGLAAEVLSEYRSHRRLGACPCVAMERAAWDWDC